MFSLNPNSGIPIYRQLMEQIRRLISGNRLSPGDTLPSVRELALTHAVNPMTISKAYSMLEAEGLLERQRGKGMIVATGPGLGNSRQERLKLLQPAVQQLVTAAEQLELNEDEVLRAVRAGMERQARKRPGDEHNE